MASFQAQRAELVFATGALPRRLGHTVSDADVHEPAGSPFPQETDQGKF